MMLTATYERAGTAESETYTNLLWPTVFLAPALKIHDRAAIGHVQSQCQGWVAVEKEKGKKESGRVEGGGRVGEC